MSDLVLNEIRSGYNLGKINVNFSEIEAKVNEEMLHTTGGNNILQQDIDLNSNRILNLPKPVGANEPLINSQLAELASADVGSATNIVYQDPESLVYQLDDFLDILEDRVSSTESVYIPDVYTAEVGLSDIGSLDLSAYSNAVFGYYVSREFGGSRVLYKDSLDSTTPADGCMVFVDLVGNRWKGTEDHLTPAMCGCTGIGNEHEKIKSMLASGVKKFSRSAFQVEIGGSGSFTDLFIPEGAILDFPNDAFLINGNTNGFIIDSLSNVKIRSLTGVSTNDAAITQLLKIQGEGNGKIIIDQLYARGLYQNALEVPGYFEYLEIKSMLIEDHGRSGVGISAGAIIWPRNTTGKKLVIGNWHVALRPSASGNIFKFQNCDSIQFSSLSGTRGANGAASNSQAVMFGASGNPVTNVIGGILDLKDDTNAFGELYIGVGSSGVKIDNVKLRGTAGKCFLGDVADLTITDIQCKQLSGINADLTDITISGKADVVDFKSSTDTMANVNLIGLETTKFLHVDPSISCTNSMAIGCKLGASSPFFHRVECTGFDIKHSEVYAKDDIDSAYLLLLDNGPKIHNNTFECNSFCNYAIGYANTSAVPRISFNDFWGHTSSAYDATVAGTPTPVKSNNNNKGTFPT